MLLSEIIKFMNINLDFKIVNEKEFDVLSHINSSINTRTCVFLDDLKYKEYISKNVTMLITNNSIANEFDFKNIGICIVEVPRLFFFELHNYLCLNEGNYIRKKFKSSIGLNCSISKLSSISEMNVHIGNNVIIEEFVVIKENTSIGNNSIIRAGTVLSGQGFEFKRKNNSIIKVEHVGGIIIGNNVEIQHNSCVDKAIYPWDNTEIGDFTKIDNLVHIGHGAKINKNVMIVAQSGIGGRTIIEPGAWIGFNATIINNIIVGENSRANIGSVVTKHVKKNGNVTGNFAINHDKFIHNLKRSL